jgi:peptide/nickel transport system ATP-binding protein
MNSLNPVMRVSAQIADAIEAHEGRQSRHALAQRIHGLLEHVGLSSRVYDLYPHELSGGMKQRVCIAMAIALNPSLIVADEPTSALDVVVQRLIAQTLQDVKQRLGVSMILIGHDMGLQAQVVDRLAVMYKGSIVELAPVESAFDDPLHPYTRLLIAAIPSIKERKDIRRAEQLAAELHSQPGCIYQFRCPHTPQECATLPPLLQEAKPGHYVACHLYEEEDERMRSYVSTAAPTSA